MRKRKFLALFCCMILLLSLTACDAESSNSMSAVDTGKPAAPTVFETGESVAPSIVFETGEPVAPPPTVFETESNTEPTAPSSSVEDPLPPLGEQDVILKEGISYSVETHSTDGYTKEYRIELYPDWIRANDDELLSLVWANYGGQKSIDDIRSFTGATSAGTNSCVMLIGKITVQNTTNGWHYSKDNPSSLLPIKVCTNCDDISSINGGKIVAEYGTKLEVESNHLFYAQLFSDLWEIPIISTIGPVFTPANPDGNSALEDIRITFMGEELTLDIPWEYLFRQKHTTWQSFAV